MENDRRVEIEFPNALGQRQTPKIDACKSSSHASTQAEDPASLDFSCPCLFMGNNKLPDLTGADPMMKVDVTPAYTKLTN